MSMIRMLQLLSVAFLVAVTALFNFPDNAQAKFWCWRISGGDLAGPILLSTEDCEQGLGFSNASGIIRVAKGEIHYTLESTGPDGEDPTPAFRYYPANSNHPAFMVPLQYEFGPDPVVIDSPYSGRDYGIWAPSDKFEAVLYRYIAAGRSREINGRPGFFEVIGTAGKLAGGTVRLNRHSLADYFQRGEGERIDLTAEYGNKVWELLSQLKLPDQPSEEPGGLARHPLDISVGEGPPIRLFYYPPASERPALIGKRYTYDLPEALDRLFRQALGIDGFDRAGGEGDTQSAFQHLVMNWKVRPE